MTPGRDVADLAGLRVPPRAALPAALLDLVVDTTIAAIVAELREQRERGNPQGDVTDDPGDTRDDAHFGDDGRERLA